MMDKKTDEKAAPEIVGSQGRIHLRDGKRQRVFFSQRAIKRWLRNRMWTGNRFRTYRQQARHNA